MIIMNGYFYEKNTGRNSEWGNFLPCITPGYFKWVFCFKLRIFWYRLKQLFFRTVFEIVRFYLKNFLAVQTKILFSSLSKTHTKAQFFFNISLIII